MYIQKSVRPLLYPLNSLYKANRWKHSKCQSLMLYNVTMSFLRYWRELEAQDFKGLDKDGSDELYYYFTEVLRDIFDCHLDLYWLMPDLDGKPLYSDGRSPSGFWCFNTREKLKSFSRLTMNSF